jgi:hypothetical protein
LRTACIRLDPTSDVLLTTKAVSSQKFIQRCGQLFGVPILRLDLEHGSTETLRDWSRRVFTQKDRPSDAQHRVYLSPSASVNEPNRPEDGLAMTPVRDRAMVALSELLVVLHLRANGNVHRLLKSRLACSEFPAASVFLVIGDGLVPRKLAEPLMDMGAVGWYMVDENASARRNPLPPWTEVCARGRSAAPIVDCPSSEDWPYLTHCTRGRLGPWPGQAEEAYLDDLLLDRSGADHSALAALWRIVRSRRLLASSELVRGPEPVVSLTAVPLPEIHQLRTFRSHLGRWDFEPYGICIRRDWLQQQGARPVHYGDDSLWEQLDTAERPFFQKSHSRTGKGAVLDWTVEREWRLLGDLRLNEIPRDAAIVFVPTRQEAHQLAMASPWPVAVLDRGWRE